MCRWDHIDTKKVLSPLVWLLNLSIILQVSANNFQVFLSHGTSSRNLFCNSPGKATWPGHLTASMDPKIPLPCPGHGSFVLPKVLTHQGPYDTVPCALTDVRENAFSSQIPLFLELSPNPWGKTRCSPLLLFCFKFSLLCLGPKCLPQIEQPLRCSVILPSLWDVEARQGNGNSIWAIRWHCQEPAS